MNKKENKYSFFEKELRNNKEHSNVDYKAIESVLFSRISDAEFLKELSKIKLDEIPPAEKIEQVEYKLFSQIVQYNEYEVPTNECISIESDLSSSQWDRLMTKIEERIQDVAAIPQWERVLMTSEREPLFGDWEKQEEALFDQINKISNCELWEQCVRRDEIQIQESLNSVEAKLDKQIGLRKDLELWEYILKTEDVLSCHEWELIDEKLFNKIEKTAPNNIEITKQPFWHMIDYYLFLTKTPKIVLVAMLLLLMVVGFYVLQGKLNSKIPTLVYQLQGKATDSNQLIRRNSNEQYSSVAGGTISLINSHGFIELQNNSEVKVNQLTKEHALYKVGFGRSVANDDVARGRVAFLVNPHHGKESFKVQTPDYQIVVKGTYFKVEPDWGGRVSTRVLEGKVKVVSKLFKDTVIKAGQSLIYDIFTNEYRIQGGGTIVQRKEIVNVPDVDELMKYKIISIKSTIAESEIRIDGKYFGTAPLTIRQALGNHHVWIGKNGYVPIDTLVVITEQDSCYTLQVGLNSIHIPNIQDTKNVVQQDKKANIKIKHFSAEPFTDQLLSDENSKIKISSVDSIYTLAQKIEKNGNWKEAIRLYQKVFDDPDVSRLRKEDVLFSIGKLKADHESIKADAQQIFLTYLALYPGGSFAGETWLRLAELEFKTNPENAVQYYLKYFEMFPRHPRIYELQNRVGVIYLQQKKYDEAISLFRQALSNLVSPVKGERENVISNLYRALEAKGDIKGADTIMHRYIYNSSK